MYSNVNLTKKVVKNLSQPQQQKNGKCQMLQREFWGS